MGKAPCIPKPNLMSEKEVSEKLDGSNYLFKDSDVHCPQGTSSMKNNLLEEPSVNVSADLPQEEPLPSVVPEKKRKRSRRSNAPTIDDSNPDCLKVDPSLENISTDINSCVQSLGRDVHLDSPHGTDTLLEEPSMNIIPDLVPHELPLSRNKKKRKKAVKGAAPESENSCLESCAGMCTTPYSEKAKQHSDLLPLQLPVTEFSEQVLGVAVAQPPMEGISRKPNSECSEPTADSSCSSKKKKNKRKKSCKTHESNDENDKRYDLSVGTSLVEGIAPGVDPSQQPPVSELLEQKLELPQPLMEEISRKTNPESSEPIADLCCSGKKKRKKRCKTQESNADNGKRCDLSVGTSMVENIAPGVDPSQQPPVLELAEQKLELTQPLAEEISRKKNPESSEPIGDLSCPSKKKRKKSKTCESNVDNDKRCDLSVGTSLVEDIAPGVDPSQQPPVSEVSEQKLELPQSLTEEINRKTNSESSHPIADFSCQIKKKKKKKKRGEKIMPGIDTSQQPPSSESSEQMLELPQPLVEGISMTASSEGPKPNTDLSCSRETKRSKAKRRHKTHESNDERCDLSVGTSSRGNHLPGVDLSVQPPVAVLSEQELEVEQAVVEGIIQRTNSESPKHIADLSCSQRRKKRRKNKSCDPSVGTVIVENIIPGEDPSLQPQLTTSSEQELCTFREKNEDKEQNKISNASGNNDDHEVRAGLPGQIVIDVNPVNDLGCLEGNGIKGFSSQCSDASPIAEITHLAVKADFDVAAVVKEGNLSQIPVSAAEGSLVSCSKKKLLILDVNGILADIVQEGSYSFNRFKPDIKISRKGVFKRPFCDEFLQFCFDRFNVGVWSSRTKMNVDMVIDFLLGDARHKLLFCWNQSHCTTTRFNTVSNWHKPLVLKELRKLWDKLDPDLPWVRGEYNESNTLLLDDSPYKALRNPVNTAIFPFSYQFRDRKDKSLGPGGDIRCYLEELAAADNVQKYVEQHPFGQRPITRNSRSWAFYRKVIEDGVQSSKV